MRMPVPATPFLIAAGALAGLERLRLAWSLAITTSASLISDYTWFRLGKSHGSFVLQWLGKKSPEPRSCAIKVRSTYSHLWRSIDPWCRNSCRSLTSLLRSWRARST
jgi:membrane protein DedA with SNARE-associated domain